MKTTQDDLWAVVVKTPVELITDEANYLERKKNIAKLVKKQVDLDRYEFEILHNMTTYDVVCLISKRNVQPPIHTKPIYFEGGTILRVPEGEWSLHTNRKGYLCIDRFGRMWLINFNNTPKSKE